jgi:O-antigen/teichoic acid export membrane protein
MKNYFGNVARNTAIMIGAQIITGISGFVVMLFLPKYLGSSGYGELYLAVSITMIFHVIIEFGGQYHVTKEISRSPESSPYIFVNSGIIRIIFWVLSVLLMILLSNTAGYSQQVLTLILILGAAKVWEGITSLLRNCYQGFELMEYPSLGSIAERFFLMGAVVTALLAGAGQTIIAVLMGLSTLINFFVSASFARKIIPKLPHPDFLKVKHLLKQGFPYFMWSIFAVIYFRIDSVILSVLTNYSVVGWYGAAYRLFDVLMFFPFIFSQALFPVLSRIAETTKETLTLAVQKSIDVVLLIGIPLSVILFFFAKDITAFLFGLAEYEPTVILLQIFSIGLLIVYVDFVLGSTVIATDRQKTWSFIAFAAIIINVALNYLLIPFFQSTYNNGGIGAAIGTVATELFIMISAILLLKNRYVGSINFYFLMRGLAGGIIMSSAFYLMNSMDINLIIQIVAGVLIYILTVLALHDYKKIGEIFSLNNVGLIRNYLGTIIKKET